MAGAIFPDLELSGAPLVECKMMPAFSNNRREDWERADRMTLVIAERGNRVAGAEGES